MEITANGEKRQVPDGITVAGLINEIGWPSGRIAVERNGEIVPKERFGSVVLGAGDRLEVVTLVGGG